MNSDIFKKITYAVVIVALLLVGYLAFIKDDSSTSKNADFLGIKTSSGDKEIGNQSDLSIDSNSEEKTNSSETEESASKSEEKDKKSGFYTVKEGDTYGCIAEAYYGSYEHWTDVLNANIVYGEGYSEQELHIGAMLEMPTISAENLKPSSKLCS